MAALLEHLEHGLHMSELQMLLRASLQEEGEGVDNEAYEIHFTRALLLTLKKARIKIM